MYDEECNKNNKLVQYIKYFNQCAFDTVQQHEKYKNTFILKYNYNVNSNANQLPSRDSRTASKWALLYLVASSSQSSQS